MSISTFEYLVKMEYLINIFGLCRLWAEIEAHKWRFLALLVDHILSEVKPATKELSAELSTPTQYWASI